MTRRARILLCGIAAAGLSVSPSAFAAPLTPGQTMQLCNGVSDQILSPAGIEYDRTNRGNYVSMPMGKGYYMFEVMLRRAAGVGDADDPATVQTKMQRWWLANRTALGCSQLGFSIRNGNVAKLAYERNSNAVINDMLRRWKLDMNFIDPADGKSVLDYVEAGLAGAKGSELEAMWQRHRDLLVRSGARRGAELR